MLISKVTCPSVHATIEASKKHANNLYFLRRRYLCEKNWTEETDCFLLGGGMSEEGAEIYSMFAVTENALILLSFYYRKRYHLLHPF